MSLVRARRRRIHVRRPGARQGPGHPRRSLGDHHSEASPPTSVTRNYEATRIEHVEEPLGALGDLDVMVPLIQALIPLGFRAAGGPPPAGGGRLGGPALCSAR